jgi:hypothetical protein
MLDQTVGEWLKDRVTLDLEWIDRLYLNLIQHAVADRFNQAKLTPVKLDSRG